MLRSRSIAYLFWRYTPIWLSLCALEKAEKIPSQSFIFLGEHFRTDTLYVSSASSRREGLEMANTDEKPKAETSKSLFRDITADDETPEVMEIESLCFKCENNGLTRLFLTRIPFFKDVIVSSFTCDNCGYHNTELQPGGRIQDKGVKYTVNIQNLKDLNRQVVQTNTATIAIPKLEFENPPNKGALTTVEGIVQRAVEGLSQDQPLRKIQHPEVAAQIDDFIVKLNELLLLKDPFDLVIMILRHLCNKNLLIL
ncbi:K06874 [Mytilus edulis]|uniref:K06874 n=1 Tax=Mytilus edulis TaxID=6550 RepID=A0A8S3TYD6_MYTED|nr:K06874 [Mytilus edulis]